jgi:hypothetical protein
MTMTTKKDNKSDSKHNIKNNISLFLNITQNSDNTHGYKYLCRMDNGVQVNLEGLIISEPTKITVQLNNITNVGYIITECLIPCDQKTVTATLDGNDAARIVTLIDRDNEPEPKDYNFVIIAKNRHTHEQIVCDPQMINKGKLG